MLKTLAEGYSDTHTSRYYLEVLYMHMTVYSQVHS